MDTPKNSVLLSRVATRPWRDRLSTTSEGFERIRVVQDHRPPNEGQRAGRSTLQADLFEADERLVLSRERARGSTRQARVLSANTARLPIHSSSSSHPSS